MTRPNANGSNATIIHMSLQGKGGVGKSLVAAILSQYLASRGQDVHGIDADPVNHTLSEYRGIGARCLGIQKDGSVDQREFDSLMERFLTQSGTFVVDTGASTFIPLWHYVLENHALEHLRERGKRVYSGMYPPIISKTQNRANSDRNFLVAAMLYAYSMLSKSP